MKIKIIFFGLIACLFIHDPSFVLAQNSYAIKLNGDTVKGSLQILGYEQIDRVQIKTDERKITLTALQVKSISRDNILYRPVRNDNTVRFMKVLINGYLTLYAFNLTVQDSWDGRFLTKKDGSGMEVPNLGFKKTLGNFLSDCGDIKNQIEEGTLGKRDLEKIVDSYNACMERKTTALFTKATPSPATNINNEKNEKAEAVKNLITKVEAENFATNKDALDILKDIESKVSKNESVANYLIDGLKSSLAGVPSLSKDLDTVVALLKK
jgi:hypothetical protein